MKTACEPAIDFGREGLQKNLGRLESLTEFSFCPDDPPPPHPKKSVLHACRLSIVVEKPNLERDLFCIACVGMIFLGCVGYALQ